MELSIVIPALNESRKIMSLPDLAASTTCVRVPVMRAHSVAIHAEFEQPVDLKTARQVIDDFPGAEIMEAESVKLFLYEVEIEYKGKEYEMLFTAVDDLDFGDDDEDEDGDDHDDDDEDEDEDEFLFEDDDDDDEDDDD